MSRGLLPDEPQGLNTPLLEKEAAASPGVSATPHRCLPSAYRSCFYRTYLPESVLQVAETLVGFMIIALAVWLLIRWRRGIFHLHPHEHEHAATSHLHMHGHKNGPEHRHEHTVRTRSPLQAYAIGVVHGMGASAGVGILLLATIRSHAIAVVALALFAFFTAVSMALLSSGFGLALSSERVRRSFHRLAPALGTTSLAFGVWYALGALSLAPYYL